jgi:hypothetical protein
MHLVYKNSRIAADKKINGKIQANNRVADTIFLLDFGLFSGNSDLLKICG